MNHIQPIVQESTRPKLSPVAPKLRKLDLLGQVVFWVVVMAAAAGLIGTALSNAWPAP